MEQTRPHSLLVVRQDRRRRPGHQVPRPHRRVGRARDHLRLACLRGHAVDRAAVSAQHHDLGLRSDVPDAADAVAPSGEQHVERGVRGDAVHAAEMAVVGPHHLRLIPLSWPTRLYSRSQHLTALSSPQENK